MAIRMTVTTLEGNVFPWFISHHEALGLLTSLFNTADIHDKDVTIMLLKVSSASVKIETTIGQLITSGIEKVTTDVRLMQRRLDNQTPCSVILEQTGAERSSNLQRFSDFRQILMLLDSLAIVHYRTANDGVFPPAIFTDIDRGLRATATD